MKLLLIHIKLYALWVAIMSEGEGRSRPPSILVRTQRQNSLMITIF